MTFRAIRHIAVAAAFLAVTVSANSALFAQDPALPRIGPPVFEHPNADTVKAKVRDLMDAVDRNNNGELSKIEFALAGPRPDDQRLRDPGSAREREPQFLTADEAWDLADLDNDNKLDAREIYDWCWRHETREHAAKWVIKFFAEHNDNTDFRLTRNEFPGGENLFDFINDAGDGINPVELFDYALYCIMRDLMSLDALEWPKPGSGEMRERIQKVMRELDTDGDRKLTPAEFPRTVDEEGMPDIVRENKPWYLTRAEAFEMADGDGNGEINGEELRDWLVVERQREHVAEWLRKFMRNQDKNEDGKVSLASPPEWPALLHHFRKIDDNGNGLVGMVELWRKGMEMLRHDLALYLDAVQ